MIMFNFLNICVHFIGWLFIFCCQVLPDDMVVLAEPDPGDMVQAIKKAITLLPMIDPQEMHDRVSAFFEVKKKTL